MNGANRVPFYIIEQNCYLLILGLKSSFSVQ